MIARNPLNLFGPEKSIYGLSSEDKWRYLGPELNRLTRFHAEHCPQYLRLLRSLKVDPRSEFTRETLPFFSVRQFKKHRLISVPESAIERVMYSSGTTGQMPSQIFLDRETAVIQQRVLIDIMREFLGQTRLPMLVIDSKSVLSRGGAFGARTAAVLGMAQLGRWPVYALSEDLSLNLAEVARFAELYAGQKVFVFGFTWLIWLGLVQSLRKSAARIDLSNAVLVHGGGWKKIENARVSRQVFREALEETCGITAVHDYYGMVEQTGSIFVECENGLLHAPLHADIVIREPGTWHEVRHGEHGMVQVLSALPKSYPGHSLLTDDLGKTVAEDDCPCGRKGRGFVVSGRLPKSEPRGCSDTRAS